MTQENHDTMTPPAMPTAEPEARISFDGAKGPLFQALAEARGHYLSLTADSNADVQLKGGGGYKHNYADLDTVIKALTPGWLATGLAVMQFLDGDFVTTVVAKGESSLTVKCPIPGYDTPQQMGSGTTYIRRYQLKAVFCVNDSEDDDANAAQGNKATVTKREPTAAPKAPTSKLDPKLTQMCIDSAKAAELDKEGFKAAAIKACGKPFTEFTPDDAAKFLEYMAAAP